MRIYISGKVTGENPKVCAAKFEQAEELAKLAGFKEIINPTKEISPFADWDEAMQICMNLMMSCTHLLLLPDWTESRGARLELDYAIRHDLIICNPSNIHLCKIS